jgi:SAM-dependent methyltransferase
MKVCLKCRHSFQSDFWECRRCGWKPDSIDGLTSFVVHNEHSDQGFDTDHFPKLYAIEKKHFWFKSRNRIIIWAFKRFFPKAATFIEVGCGTGFVLHAIKTAMPQLKVSGSELFIEGLVFAKQRVPHSTLFQMNAENIPFVDEFGVLGAFDVLEHITNDQKVLSEFFAALKKGGGIILTIPQHPALWSRFDVKSCHVRRYTRKEIVEKISVAGFRTVFVSSFVTILLPFMMADRWKSDSIINQQETGESVNIPGILNFMFELALTFELLLLRIGISLPFGGSLLVIAKK